MGLLIDLSCVSHSARGVGVTTNIYDADGDKVTVSLLGPGTMLVTLNDPLNKGLGSIQSIALNGVDAKSSLSIAVKRKGGFVTVENLIANGPLAGITAGSANLSGGTFSVNGVLGRATFASLSNLNVTIGPSIPTNATVLSGLTVSGAIDNVMMDISGSVQGVTAGQIIDSWVFAGYTPASQTNVMAGGAFSRGIQIRSLTLTKAWPRNATNEDYVNSIIAADKIGSVTLKTIQTNNGEVRFGILANSAVTSVTATDPAFNWKAKGAIAQGVGDFRVRSLAAVTVSTNVQILAVPNLSSSTNSSNLLFDANSVDMQTLQPGTVLAGGVGKGFLVKVVSASNQGQLVSVQTVPATLQDALTEGAFDESITFNPTTLLYAAPGVTFNTNGLTPEKFARAEASGLKNLVANANHGQLIFNYDLDEVEIDSYVTMNGSVSLTLTPNLSAQFGLLSGLQAFSASVTGDLLADLDLSVGDALTNSADKVIWQTKGEPTFFSVGLVPVVVIPTLELHAGYDASLEAAFGMDASLSASLTTGAQWTRPAGWSPIWTPSASFSAEPNTPSVTATLNGYLRPEIVLEFYGVSGPDIYLQGGGKLNAEAKLDPPEVCFSMTGNFDAGVGIDLLSIGNLNISYEKQFAELDKTIFDSCDKFTVTTLAASDVTTNSATLNGEVNPGAAEATAHFEWGTDTNYGNTTSVQNVQEGGETVPLNFALPDLQRNTTYHFRLVGTKGNVTNKGIDQEFSTAANAAAAFGIGFDDLSTPTLNLPDIDDNPLYLGDVSDNYNGFTWNNLGVEDGITSVNTGYYVGTISPNNVCYNEFGNPGSMTSSAPFNFYSAYLTGAWNDGLQVEVQGYTSGVLLYDNTYTLSSTSPIPIAFNYLGVDEVDFNSFGGTHNPNYVYYGEQFLMDNVVVATNAPLNSLATREFAGKNRNASPLTQRIKNGEAVFKPRPANANPAGSLTN